MNTETRQETLPRWQHREFAPADLPAVLDLRFRVFREAQYDTHRWSWQYRENPFGEGIIDLAVDSRNPEILAGHYAVIRQHLRLSGLEVRAVQSLDTFTSPDYLRQGIFVKLAEETFRRASSEGVKFVFGFPNRNSYPGFVKNLGFKDPFGFGIYKLPLRASYYLERGFLKKFHLPLPSLFRGRKSSGSLTHREDTIPQDLSGLVENSWRGHHGVAKSVEYLKWRYQNCPDRQYEFYSLRRESEIRAFLVLGRDARTNFGHIVDIFGASQEEVRTLIEGVAYRLRKSRLKCLSFFANEGSPLNGVLRQIGFSYTDRSRDFRFILRSLTGALPSELLSGDRWHIVGGDTDFY